MKKYALIVAGGSGLRMKKGTPKQFLLLKGLPILMHSIKAFAESSAHPEIILVINIDFIDVWESLCKQYQFNIPHRVVKGGDTRFDSVRKGLQEIEKNSIVAIHDGVRPLVSQDIILRSYETAEREGTAVTAIPVTDSLRKREGLHTISVAREDYMIVQTPQTFQSDILFKAYRQKFRNEFTDDASVVESSGEKINLIEGHIRNLKITYPEDLILAESYME